MSGGPTAFHTGQARELGLETLSPEISGSEAATPACDNPPPLVTRVKTLSSTPELAAERTPLSPA